MVEEEILGTSKVSKDGKITLVLGARKVLRASEGTIIVFFKSKKGDIMVRRGSLGVP